MLHQPEQNKKLIKRDRRVNHWYWIKSYWTVYRTLEGLAACLYQLSIQNYGSQPGRAIVLLTNFLPSVFNQALVKFLAISFVNYPCLSLFT